MKKVFNLLVVDESGSMEVIRREALAGMNETLTTIKKMQEVTPGMKQYVTLLLFDSRQTRFYYDNVSADRIHELSYSDYQPCAATPLYDAIGRGIARINAQAADEDHVVVTIITDGEENSSREYTLRQINNLIAKLEKQNWTFAFIGTDNLDVESTAHAMNIKNCCSFKQDEAGTKEMFQKEMRARVRMSYKIMSDCPMSSEEYFKEKDDSDISAAERDFMNKVLGEDESK